jgi:hypothetical protein
MANLSPEDLAKVNAVNSEGTRIGQVLIKLGPQISDGPGTFALGALYAACSCMIVGQKDKGRSYDQIEDELKTLLEFTYNIVKSEALKANL